MAQSVLSAPQFHDEEAAYAFVEARVWPNGPVCAHCGSCERIGKMGGKSTRIGLYKCYACRKPFTVKVGSIFEASHVELKLWLQAMHLMCASKKDISSNQLHRTLGVTLKTAWFMSHRIREAMTTVGMEPMGGEGAIVEIDGTFKCMKNIPYYGDNLDVLRESIASESVDLIYLDPPFNSQASYNVLFHSQAGRGSQAQVEAFEQALNGVKPTSSLIDTAAFKQAAREVPAKQGSLI